MSAVGRVYLDHNASAPLGPEARAAMIAALDLDGNASSVHAEGRRARAVVEDAREAVAALVGAKPEDIVFTSGATESNNWSIQCAGMGAGRRLAVGAIEHESVLAPATKVDPDLVVLPCDGDGVVDVDPSVAILRGLEGEGGCFSLQFANGETGVIQNIAKAAAAMRAAGFAVHCDAVQAVGRIGVDFAALGLDLMSVSSHKIGGPKGVGALVIRDGFDLPPLMAGGGQERRRRSGTENVAAIAGFGAAAKTARAGVGRMCDVARLRDMLEEGVAAVTPEAVVIGRGAKRLPNTSCIAVTGAQAASLLIKLDLAGIAVSAGSACSSGKIGSSHVLAAMGVEKRLAQGALRISLGRTTTADEIERFLAAWEAIHVQAKPVQRKTKNFEAAPIGLPLVQTGSGE
jgi:cysteine desulfurase